MELYQFARLMDMNEIRSCPRTPYIFLTVLRAKGDSFHLAVGAEHNMYI